MTFEVFSYMKTDLQEGYYLLRVGGKLTIAELVGNSWYPTGVEYDPWQYHVPQPKIEVICRFDLEKIAAGAAKQE